MTERHELRCGGLAGLAFVVLAMLGKFLPGTHIPIYSPEQLAETRPDYILVLPWNLREEISSQLSYVRSWGGRLVFPIPVLEIV